MNILEQYKGSINGSFSSFDRIIIRGHLNRFFSSKGAGSYVSSCGVLFKDFADYAKNITEDLKTHVENLCKEEKRPLIYVASSKLSKEDIALKALEDSPIDEGLICVISTVEECYSLQSGKIAENTIGMKRVRRKCLHYYFYIKDKKLGFMFLRLQTWFPFEIMVYINGRELLRSEFEKNNIQYSMYDNSFSTLSDIDLAQQLADKMVDKAKDLSSYFDKLADKYNNYLSTFKKINGEGYRWYLYQCEYATDIMFKTRKSLEDIYPSLVEHAFDDFDCRDVFSFMGRKLTSRFQGEAIADYKHRPIGYRIKFKLNSNSIKIYDKGNCLRIELTINNPYEFKVMKTFEDDQGKEVKRWVPMGKALSNFYRYAQIGKECNNRLIASLNDIVPVVSTIEKIEKVCSRKKVDNRSVTALNVWQHDTYHLLKTISSGDFLISGITNSNIRDILYPDIKDKDKRSSKTTRTIRKLREHNIIRKVSHSTKYFLTKKGRQITSSLIYIREHMYPEAVAKFAQ